MYHVLCFPSRFEYSHMYAVHLLTREKPPLEEALNRCTELYRQHIEQRLSESEKRWRKEVFCCVGYEHIPIDIDKDHYVSVLFWWKDWHGDEPEAVYVATDVPQELKDRLFRYRATRLTVDVDEPYFAVDAYEEARKVDPSVKVYRTSRGYHIKGRYVPRTFSELFELRKRMHDDKDRIAFDEAYVEAGLSHLFNVLFNEKCWLDGGKWACYAEAEVDPRTLTKTVGRPLGGGVELQKGVELEMPWNGRRLLVRAEKDAVTVTGYIRADERESVLSAALELVKKTQEYREAERRRLRAELFERYEWISRGAVWVLSQCAVSFSDDNSTIYIDVPEKLADRAGLLIGKNGANVKSVEQRLGKRIVIRAPKTEREVMKDRMRRLLSEFVSSGVSSGVRP